MAALLPAASPLFLTEPELRRGIELMLRGYGRIARATDDIGVPAGIGRAHGRALYFIARRPGLPVGELLALLAITKQSLARVLGELVTREFVAVGTDASDRRKRRLTLTPAGAAIETRLFTAIATRMAAAYSHAGQDAVGGFWAVLEGLVAAES